MAEETQNQIQTEQAYLKSYNIHDYDVPLTTVDSVLLSVLDNQLMTLLVRRANHPFKGKWGLPGGFIDLNRDACLEDCANRNLAAKTGIIPPYLEQLCSTGNALRDPRGWSTTVTYFALMAQLNCKIQSDAVEEVRWLPVSLTKDLDLAFDHRLMIEKAVERLTQKALYSLVPLYALPELFTLLDLQRLHEVILGKSLQKKAFRLRVERADVLEPSGQFKGGRGKPAPLYRAKPGAAEYRFSRNLEA